MDTKICSDSPPLVSIRGSFSSHLVAAMPRYVLLFKKSEAVEFGLKTQSGLGLVDDRKRHRDESFNQSAQIGERAS